MKKILIKCMAITAAMLAFTACSSDSSNENSAEKTFADNNFSISGATYHDAQIPASTAGAPAITGVSANTQALQGGANFIQITSDQVYERFYIAVEGQQGYMEYNPETQTQSSSAPSRAGGTIITYIIPITYGSNYDRNITMIIKGLLEDGTITPAYRHSVSYVESMDGDLNINLTFSNAKDIDMWLVTPSGDEIYYGNRTRYLETDTGTVAYGLDHDSNAGCTIDNLNNENIVVPAAAIECGEYEVRLYMFRNCDPSISTSWQIAVRYKGELVKNLQPIPSAADNAIAYADGATTLESSIGSIHNPVWGEYPVNTPDGGSSVYKPVFKFKLKEASASAPKFDVTRSYVPTAMDRKKMEAAKLLK